jgi:8-oxo-dGTP diphosphatase
MITVSAAILTKDNKVFLARRNLETKHAGKWEFPGGKMEQDESGEQCLSREIKEEFSINITVNEFFAESIHEYEHAKIRLLAYRISWVSGKMVPKDHDRIAWVSPDKLLEYDLLPADIPIAQECKKRINSR